MRKGEREEIDTKRECEILKEGRGGERERMKEIERKKKERERETKD